MQTNVGTKGNSDIDQLNSFLRGEISAVETYRQAIEKLSTSPHVMTLRECLRSHEQRVAALTQEIRRLGGQPAASSGVWGAFAKVLEGGAKVFGEKAAIAALEEGEDHGRDDYRRDVDKLSAPAKQFVQGQLTTEQERTHRSLSALKHSLH
jgi:demethoxyubiquinone hydroxylase (CLK1/Coq7/Cat5 family)